MTTRNLDALFNPASVALIGASARPGSVGQVVTANLLGGGFAGKLMFVDPKGGEVQFHPVYASVAALPAAPDLAIIATPARTIPGLISELGARGCRAAVVISAGFEGSDAAGAALRQAILDAARPHLLRIVGPNCLGLLSPANGLNASFARTTPPSGPVALVAQSGAVAAAALDWAPAHGLGFSHVVTLGDSLDVDIGDILDSLGRDPGTRVILAYIESLGDARKFMSAARYASQAKPIVMLKGGRSEAGAKAAFSHTRALAGADAVYSAAFRRAGVLQVDGLDALLDAALVLTARQDTPAGGLTILTNGGGAGVLAVDALSRAGGVLTTLSPATQAALRALMPASGACGNPVDILGDAGPDLYRGALDVLLAAPEVEAVLTINCPTAVADSGQAAEAVIAAVAAQASPKPVLAAWLGEASVATARAVLGAARTPVYESPEAAVRAFMQIGAARDLRRQLAEAPDGSEGAGDAPAVRAIVAKALDAGRTALEPMEVQAVLAAYGVPIVQTRIGLTHADAGAAAAAAGGPVALKILSPQLTHKSDVGGVQLGLTGAVATESAAQAMLSRLQSLRPDARLDGFLIQPMIDRPKAVEILAGVVRDPTFGPVVVVGHGGVAVEVLADRALALPPLNATLARDMIARTHVARLLAGYRDRPAADLDALSRVLVALGRLVLDVPEISELDLNPVLCDADGVIAVDARIAIRRPDATTARAAILPYPSALERRVQMGGEDLLLRPIRPRDASHLTDMIALCEPNDRRLRFAGAMQSLNPALAAQLCQIDYDRHMALVLEDGAGQILGVGRLASDPRGDAAEFALIVRSDHQNGGLGRLLLDAVLDHARACGLTEVWGDVAVDNPRMLEMAEAFGFTSARSADDPGRLRVTKRLP